MATKKRIDIEARTKGFDKAKKESKGLSKSLGSLKNSLMGAAAGYFAAQGLIAGIQGSLDAYAQQELAEKKLRFALKGNTKALTDQAAAMQRTTTFGDEAIITQQAFLASIGMTKSQILDILPVAADLAAATGMTLESAVRNTAKTFSGLAGELGELVPQLRDLTAEEMKAGEAVEVMAELFGGQAAADAESYAGSISQLSNAWGDLKESIGEQLAPTVKAIADGFKSLIEISVSDSLIKEKEEFLALTGILKDSNISMATRKEAIKMLNKEYKPYLRNLDIEKASLADINRLEKEAQEAFESKIRTKILEEDMSSATESRIEAEFKLFKLQLKKKEMQENESESYGDLMHQIENNIALHDISIESQKKIVAGAIEEEQRVRDLQSAYLNSSSIWKIMSEEKKKNNEEEKTETENKKTLIDLSEIEKTLREDIAFLTVGQAFSISKQLPISERMVELTKDEVGALMLKEANLKDLNNLSAMTLKSDLLNAKDEWKLSLTMAIINAASSVLKAGKQGGIKGALAMTAITLPNVASIAANKPAQTGFEGVIDEPTQFTVGEGGAAEYVSVQPMEGVNNAGGTGVTVNISGNVMTQEFVEEELADKIAEAVRKGVAFA